MNRIAANLSVAALLASAALLAPACTASTPADTDEEIAEEAAAIEADALAESQVEIAIDDPGVALEDTQCAGTWSYMPAGAQTWVNPDGSLGYKLPAGFVSIEEDPVSGALVTAGGGTITCTCDKGTGGCSPASAGGKTGCLIGDGCTTCTKSGATKIVDISAGVAFAGPAEVSNLPPVTPALLGVPFVADAFAQFKDMVAADAGLPGGQALDDPKTGMAVDEHTYMSAPGWALAAVNVFGHLALISVPEEYGMMAAVAWGSKQTCDCSAGSGCKAGSVFGAKYCDAGNCTVCSMTLSVAATDAVLMSIDKTPSCGAE